MKIAVLADIHANFQALQSVGDHVEAWGPDRVFVVGDTINRGPRSKDCLRYVTGKQRSANWQVVRGNHEDYVLHFEEPDAPTHGPRFKMTHCTYWNYQKLSPHEMAHIKTLPYQIEQTVEGEVIRAVHGSMLGIRKGIYPHTSPQKLPQMIAPAPSLLMVGHTHKPLLRTVDGAVVVNAGSVGLPFDGDTRPSYAQIRRHRGRWEVEIVRLDYNQEAAIQDFYQSGFLIEGGGMAEIILTELKLARSLISPWLKRYREAVLAKEISVEEGVREFLGEIGDEG